MVISKKMQDAINKQINRELYSAYLYMAMAVHFDSENLPGFSHWMKIQVQEEFGHAMKFYGYVIERGGRIVMGEIEAPQNEWKSPLAVFEQVYAHEQKVTEMINGLLAVAREEKDAASEIFLQWFITEQIEEEASASENIEKIKMLIDAPGGLFMLDRELALRQISGGSGNGENN